MKDDIYLQKLLSKLTRRSHVSRTGVPRRVQQTPQPPSRLPAVLSFLVPILAVATAWLGTSAYRGNEDLWRKQSIYQVPPIRLGELPLMVDCNGSVCCRWREL